jgi:hypothetical protein
MMDWISKLLCNQAGIITERRRTRNGKPIQPIAPFLMF